MARDTSVAEDRSRIRTSRAQSLVCHVTSRGPWFGGGSKKVSNAPVHWAFETRTISTRGVLFHPRSRNLALSRMDPAVEAEDHHPEVHAAV